LLPGRLVVFRDITNHKRAEDAIRQHSAKLQRLLDQAPAVIWSTNNQFFAETFFDA